MANNPSISQSKNTPNIISSHIFLGRHADQLVQDELQKYSDIRVRPDTNEFWEGNMVEINGEKYLKVDTANRVLAENHMLRETLYMQEADLELQAFDIFSKSCRYSTSNVKNAITKIAAVSKVLSEKEIYNFLYAYMANMHNVDFSECPASMSKINWLWENGWLPFLYTYCSILLDLCNHFKSLAPIEYNTLAIKMQKRLQRHKYKAQKKRRPSTKVTF